MCGRDGLRFFRINNELDLLIRLLERQIGILAIAQLHSSAI